MKHIREVTKEHEEHLEALENGETFVPRLTGKQAKTSKKRKFKGKEKSGAFKKRRTTPDSDDDDFITSDDTSEDDSDSDKSDSSDDDSDNDGEDSNDEGSLSGSDGEDEASVTEESLKTKVREGKDKIKALRAKLTEAREKKKEASDKLARFKKSLAKVQREKNAFCSLKRSEVSEFVQLKFIPLMHFFVIQFSREVLKEDFRTGLKDLDGVELRPPFVTSI